MVHDNYVPQSTPFIAWVYLCNTVGTIYYIFTCKFGLLKVDGWGQNPIAPMQEASYSIMQNPCRKHGLGVWHIPCMVKDFVFGAGE